ncbi:conserved Plasmodium protein, unknown function [Plasmodium knowlesi strain H]|uniref:Uncharacterized protein n=3 Tax=Plasmodium knowlesi TaxID=5850 RepID=A0A5K1UJS6_PLAKH|nr:conserved protein, unknown function [Plasmodium knowlesi strain H]OTN68554.1 Uncharacterized protein PKNOH_S02311100 [Plasmodium knowlesi]CAA9986612.1 conserved protein, unknown function [Plasmodium knowlesi strain H]SBO24111.1 conserved Plasmodium protein, unknown function [Plasmodium knowlesi strain H]SBO29323.1 conserved Plasmodium protein, unknown function [Plasmodium knowlesi strain H]VVS76086.1 conserved protein, unknown function [Plasmodium knowlesi strain H]|eukprot:XP_002261152.1 hypothetical protein, conserved in Plasmodium species [Plasmodium knowlesi strain H]
MVHAERDSGKTEKHKGEVHGVKHSDTSTTDNTVGGDLPNKNCSSADHINFKGENNEFSGLAKASKSSSMDVGLGSAASDEPSTGSKGGKENGNPTRNTNLDSHGSSSSLSKKNSKTFSVGHREKEGSSDMKKKMKVEDEVVKGKAERHKCVESNGGEEGSHGKGYHRRDERGDDAHVEEVTNHDKGKVPKKIKNVNEYLLERRSSQKITVFVGEKMQKVKADFKYGEDAHSNVSCRADGNDMNGGGNVEVCKDGEGNNEHNRVIEKKQKQTVFTAQLCKRSNADARACEELIKEKPEKTVFEAQLCQRSNADARACEELCKKQEKTIFESQLCERSNADARAGEDLAKKNPEQTIFEAQLCKRSNADARAGEELAKKQEKTVFESQASLTSKADARACDRLEDKLSGESVVYESQKCVKSVADFKASDKIKEVMKRNMADECHTL